MLQTIFETPGATDGPRPRHRPTGRRALAPLAPLALLVVVALLPEAVAMAADDATAEIRGTAAAMDGQPVVRGEAKLVDLGKTVRLDGEGRFVFTGLAPGSYLVEVTSPIAGSGVTRVEVAAGAIARVQVTLDLAVVSESVVVTASPLARGQLEVAQATSVLAGAELEELMGVTLGETLSHLPGVSASSFGPGASRPVIRGQGGDRVRMLTGGLGSADASSSSPDHAVSVEPLGAERIEVVRGPATLLYGSSAVGGVVNVLDGRIPSVVPEQAVTGIVELVGGSVSDERSGRVSLDGGSGRFAWHVDGSRRETEDYEIPGFAELHAGEEEPGDDDHGDEEEAFGILPNSAVDNRSAGLGFSWVGDRGYLGLSASGFDSLYGVPGHGEEEGEEPGGDEEGEEGVRIDLEQRRVDLEGQWQRSGGFLSGIKLRLGANEYAHRELEGAEVGTRFANDALEGRLELVQRRRGRHSGASGVQVLTSDFAAIGEEAFVPPSTTDSLALFTFQEIAAGDFTYQLGARYETQDTEPDAGALPALSHQGLSASLGVVWQLAAGWSATAAAARTVRLPTTNELYADGPHVATRAFEIGDPAFEEETGLGLDLALRRTAGRVTGSVSLFANRYDDYIFETFTGEVRDGLEVIQLVQEDAELRGGEVEVRVAVVSLPSGGHVDVSFGADWVDAELRRTGEPLPRIPPLQLSAGAAVHQGPWRGRLEVRRSEEQDDLGANETPTDGYTLVDASVGYRLVTRGLVTDLLLRGANLTDEEARNHLSFLKDEAPLPGRDVSLSLRLRF